MDKVTPKKNLHLTLSLICALAFGALVMFFFWDADAGNSNLKTESQNPVVPLVKTLKTAQETALPMETIAELGKKLGIEKESEILKQAQEFADRLSGGFIPADWKEKCPQENSRPVCAVVADFFTQFRLEANKKNRRRVPRLSLSVREKNVERLQALHFGSLLRAVPTQKKGYDQWVVTALKTKACPRNFSLALARKIEERLPEKKALQQILKLDEHGLECMEPNNEYAEFLNLRAALLHIYADQWTEAESFLRAAIAAVEKREEYRSLYWLARTLNKLNRSADAKLIVTELSARYPVSWFHIANPDQNRGDPLKVMVERPLYQDSYDFSGDEVGLMRARWLRLLMYLDKNEFVVTKYGEWMLSRLPQDISEAFLQHMARLFEMRSFHKLQIQAGNMIVSRRPQFVTMETMRLLFPKPYFDEISNATPGFDTAVLIGLARQESGFDIRARSGANARGLLQVLPSTAKSIKRAPTDKLYDSEHNILVGAKFFAKLLKRFDNQIEFSLAGYNAGGGRVDRWVPQFYKNNDMQLWMDLIPFRETRDYVPSILRNAYWYHRLFDEIEFQERSGYVYSELISRELKRVPASTVKEVLKREPSKK